MKRHYAIKTRFSFTGTFFISACNRNEAREFVEKQCGLVMGRGIHTTLADEDADWDFPMHPDMTIGRISEMSARRFKLQEGVKRG